MDRPGGCLREVAAEHIWWEHLQNVVGQISNDC